MRVVLLQDVPKVGRKHEVKNVASGHALNFLIPKRLADAATPTIIKKLEEEKALASVERSIREDLLAKSLKSIDGIVVKIEEKANDKGHLFAAVHKEQLIHQISKQTGFEILPEFIILEKPIKEVGEHTVAVKVGDKNAEFKVVVKAEK